MAFCFRRGREGPACIPGSGEGVPAIPSEKHGMYPESRAIEPGLCRYRRYRDENLALRSLESGRSFPGIESCGRLGFAAARAVWPPTSAPFFPGVQVPEKADFLVLYSGRHQWPYPTQNSTEIFTMNKCEPCRTGSNCLANRVGTATVWVHAYPNCRR